MRLLAPTLAIAAKDLRIERRGRIALTAVLPFAATLLLAFGLSLGPGRTLLQETAPALLWLAVLFASILSFRKAYQLEAEDGALEGLLLAPIDRAAVYLGKLLAVGVELLVIEAALMVLAAALFGIGFGAAMPLVGVLVLGTLALCAVAGLFGALAEQSRAREAIFPLLVLPLVTPALVAAIGATALVSAGSASGIGPWLGLLLAFDCVFLALGTLVFSYLVED